MLELRQQIFKAKQAQESCKEITTIEDYLELYKSKLKLPYVEYHLLKHLYYRKTGVYFLIKNNHIIYVGKSSYCIHSRVFKHKKLKKFDTVFFIDIKCSVNTSIAEYVFINIFNPNDNIIDKNFEFSNYKELFKL